MTREAASDYAHHPIPGRVHARHTRQRSCQDVTHRAAPTPPPLPVSSPCPPRIPLATLQTLDDASVLLWKLNVRLLIRSLAHSTAETRIDSRSCLKLFAVAGVLETCEPVLKSL
jgi:hypothetical protein